MQGSLIASEEDSVPHLAARISFGQMFRARLRAGLVHLAVSVTVAVTLMLLVTLVWYPSPLFDLAKGRDIFLLLLGCDITLGPVMTLIIFNIRKPRTELVRDVAIIATVQLAAMVYGASTLLQARPAYIVYNAGQFNVPLANEMAIGMDEKEGEAKVQVPWFGPRLVGARLPQDLQENNRLLFSSAFGGGDVFQMTRYFVPYDDVKQEVIARSRTTGQIAKEMRIDARIVEAAVAPYTKKNVSFGLLPLVVRKTLALAVVDRSSGALLGIEPLGASTETAQRTAP